MAICAGCNNAILDRYVFHVLEKAWHASCIQCADCKELLSETCFTRDGLILCRKDFARRYGTRCAGCNMGLDRNDLVRRARDKIFHVQCFQCTVCQKKLDTGEQLYILNGNRFVCKHDYLANPDWYYLKSSKYSLFFFQKFLFEFSINCGFHYFRYFDAETMRKLNLLPVVKFVVRLYIQSYFGSFICRHT
uniref:LIM zinc-binding domain-containing protein n=1 Tax=Wuchereria bancrofti TaxID=6293 RepID=A0A1I8EMJ3_WUCBA